MPQLLCLCCTDEEYVRREMRDADKEGGDTMKTLRWDGASLRKVQSLYLQKLHTALCLTSVHNFV